MNKGDRRRVVALLVSLSGYLAQVNCREGCFRQDRERAFAFFRFFRRRLKIATHDFSAERVVSICFVEVQKRPEFFVSS